MTAESGSNTSTVVSDDHLQDFFVLEKMLATQCHHPSRLMFSEGRNLLIMMSPLILDVKIMSIYSFLQTKS